MYHEQTPTAGQRNTASRTIPVPSQSPATGVSPARPKKRNLSVASKALLPFESSAKTPSAAPTGVGGRNTPIWEKFAGEETPPETMKVTGMDCGPIPEALNGKDET